MDDIQIDIQKVIDRNKSKIADLTEENIQLSVYAEQLLEQNKQLKEELAGLKEKPTTSKE